MCTVCLLICWGCLKTSAGVRLSVKMMGSVGQPILWVTISQQASWLLLHPASQSFSQAASQPISQGANKSDCWPAGPSVNPLITSRPSVSQEPSRQSPSRWTSRPVSHPVSRPVRYVNIYFCENKRISTRPYKIWKRNTKSTHTDFYDKKNISSATNC